MTSSHKTTRPPYPAEDMKYAFTNINAAESTLFVGVGSIGKSNFLRRIADYDVKETFFHEKAGHYLLVYLDPHKLLQPENIVQRQVGRLWAGYELLMNRLLRTLGRMAADGQWTLPAEEVTQRQIITNATENYELMRGDSPIYAQSALRYVEDTLEDLLAERPGLHLVFLFDELEEFVRKLPAEFFQSLRGLRDDYKQQLYFVATSRYTTNDILYQNREQAERTVIEGFIELFKGHQRFISRLDYRTTMRNLERYEANYHQTLPENIKNLLYLATHGHVGLLRTSYFALLEREIEANPDLERFCALLLQDEGVRSECNTIIDSLLDYERDALVRWMYQPDENQRLFSLINKQLFVTTEGKQQLLPILGAYVNERKRDFDAASPNPGAP